MTLRLTSKWEHALLGAVAKEASQAPGATYLGRTALQKIAYFLKVLGVPMRYQFDLYHYGPYCDAISRDVEWLLADQVVQERSVKPEKYSSYRPGPNTEELLTLHAATLSEHLPSIRKVVHALAPLNPDHLELIATLDYVFRALKATKDESPTKDEVLARFLDVKGSKFDREAVATAYDSLAGAGLLR